MSEVRLDPLSGQTVILAPVRGGRPHSQTSQASACPFCPGQEHETPPAVLELSLDASPETWFVRVFPNLYPIVSRAPKRRSDTATDARPASGIHEVIVETPRHDQEMAQRSAEELLLTLKAYRERLNAITSQVGMRYVSVFRNAGTFAGSSLAHPHSQVVALSYVPQAVAEEVRHWRRYNARTGRCLLCDELAREQQAGARVVLEQNGFILYAPFGSPASGQLILAPLQHKTSFGAEDDDALSGLSHVLLSAVSRLHTAFDDPPYNLVLQTWPRGNQSSAALHWYLRIIPRRAVLGGFELSTGDFVSTLTPEDAATRYRNSKA